MEDIKKEIIKRTKQLREEHGFSIEYISSFLDITEEEYIRFEAGETDVEYDYFIVTTLAFLYNVPIDYVFGKGEKEKPTSHVCDIPFSYKQFIKLHYDKLADIIASLKTISEKEFLQLSKSHLFSKFKYADKNGVLWEIVIKDGYASSCGYYFTYINNEPEIAYFEYQNDTEYFVLEDKIYPLKFNDIQISGMIYAKIEN